MISSDAKSNGNSLFEARLRTAAKVAVERPGLQCGSSPALQSLGASVVLLYYVMAAAQGHAGAALALAAVLWGHHCERPWRCRLVTLALVLSIAVSRSARAIAVRLHQTVAG